MTEISEAKASFENVEAAKVAAKSNKVLGACVLLVVPVVAPLFIALWCANVGVMARAWHWMLGGF